MTGRRGTIRRTMPGPHQSAVDWPRAGPWFGLAVVLFFLNDLVFLNLEGYRSWVAADYLARLAVLAFLLAPAAPRAAVRSAIAQRPRLALLIAVAAGATVLGLATDLVRLIVRDALPGLDGIRFPAPDSSLLHAIDLTAGLALVAITEELAFRAPLLLAVRDRRIGLVAGLVVSSLLFGLMHWSNGIDNIASNVLTGFVLGGAALGTKSLWPAIAAHYLIDLWHFA